MQFHFWRNTNIQKNSITQQDDDKIQNEIKKDDEKKKKKKNMATVSKNQRFCNCTTKENRRPNTKIMND